jgi:hypothetical protein
MNEFLRSDHRPATYRDAEQVLLHRCAEVAHDAASLPVDGKEANVFRLAAMVVESRFPIESTRLMLSSDMYFSAHPAELLPAVEVVKRGWVANLPRLRDMLTVALRGS